MSSAVATVSEEGEYVRPGLLDRLGRAVVTRQLDKLEGGAITLQDAAGATSLGRAGNFNVAVRVRRPRFFRGALLGGTLSVAESYIQGDWDCDDLTALFRLFLRSHSARSRFDQGLSKFAGVGHRLFHRWHANSRRGSQRNIAVHYDLGNDFFRLWLDETMAYSCGVFPEATASLKDASSEKFDRVCRKLDLQSTDRVLEIGAGWGGFALHAAANYGCHVTTTTISRNQFDHVRRRIEDSRLHDRVTLLDQDYRDLRGEFDKLVSIEMIEAVGHRFLDRYFTQLGRLLRPDGSLVLQAIVMPERVHKGYLKSVDFIQRYVFPGGCLPSLASILESAGRVSDLRFVHAEDFASHYAETLRRWRQAFYSRQDEIRRLGYGDDFLRLWDYYLCYCQAAFEERHVGVLQIQFDKPGRRRPFVDFSKAAAGDREGTSASRPVLVSGDANEPS
ncbi:MAG TPA: cyclopropane-fatty-acyl-phospholipid synthase family protein [Pirellulales bacterium]|nr:cyclopropane-fatty-acyl-phospholipid synthase family protein [Pirellulales bacterium]